MTTLVGYEIETLGVDGELEFDRADRDDALGLQRVHELTHQLHGTLAVRRATGTTFSVTFDGARHLEGRV